MSVQITVTSTAEDLDQAWEQLKAQLVEVAEAAPADAPLDAARRKLDELWPRLGSTLREVLTAAASFDGPFTSDEWVAALGISGKSFRSRTGNIGRSLRVVNERMGSVEPRVWEWDDEQERYYVTTEMRQAIRERSCA